MKIEFTKHLAATILSQIKYGTLVTNLPSFPQSVYIKLDKKRIGNGITLNWTTGHSVLLNIDSGTLREVDANTYVIILDGRLQVAPVDNPNADHLKY